jgi:YD repeat-containing protein
VGWHALVFLMMLIGALWAGPAMSAEVRTVMDLKGQIIAIVDADGSVATYSWDLSGNLTGITRISPGAGPVAITLVSPNQGLPNDPISIYGKGLANPSSVTFNGVAATVLESSANYIKTTVPATTTGTIHAVTPLGQADSPSAFTVLGAMTISPTTASLLPAQTQQFTASGAADWLVNGIQGGTAQLGTVTAGGLYTAPSTGTFPQEVTVAAQSPGNPLNRAEALLTILPPPTGPGARG